jgi:glucose-6-phosphate 1-dehydrogenase
VTDVSPPEGADVLVIFGVTGDLAHTMTFRALYRLEAAGMLHCPIIGVAIDNWSQQQLLAAIAAAVQKSGEQPKTAVMAKLGRRLSYLRGDFTDPATYTTLAAQLTGTSRPHFYLEIPPTLFGPVVTALADADLLTGATVMIEKPFGHDLASARALNDELHHLLAEDQILRIDHFLGKQPVLDIQFLRFANVLFEPVWNRDHITAVQISLAEDFGVEHRGPFYDPVGALRDVVQNHLLQLLSLIAMEPPVGPGPTALWDKKLEVFQATANVDPDHCVRGQYDGYQAIPGVAKDSGTETYVALRLQVDNTRWAGVPFFIRAGKALTTRSTEVRVLFTHPPRLAFLDQSHHTAPNELIFRIDPEPGVRLVLLSKDAQGKASRDVHLDLAFAAELGASPGPYERLLRDALVGDHTLFTREDVVEETWRVLQPLIQHPPPALTYPRGSWGPPEADTLLRGHPAWQPPWLPDLNDPDS